MTTNERLSADLVKIGSGCKIAPTVLFLQSDDGGSRGITIGCNVTIRDYSIIYDGASVGDECTIDHMVIIRESVKIGSRTRVMNRTEIGRDVVIGNGCRICGFIANRCQIGNECSSFGQLLHCYPMHGGGRVEPSPIIGNNVTIGWNAIIVGGLKIADGKFIPAGKLQSECKKLPPL